MRPGFIPMGTDPVIEWMFSLVVIFASFLIYFKTKEIYELSLYKGVKYFRYVFFFFGITYLSRILFKILRPSLAPMKYLSGVGVFSMKFLLGFGIYASSAMFIYLLLSFFWKKLDKTFVANPLFIHGISVFIAIFSIFQRTPYLFSLFQTIAFVSVLFLLIKYKKNIFHKKQNPWVITTYAMIFGHWILIAFIEMFSFSYPILGSIIYIISLCFFVVLIDRIYIHFSKLNELNQEIKNEKKRKTRSNKRYSSNNKRKK